MRRTFGHRTPMAGRVAVFGTSCFRFSQSWFDRHSSLGRADRRADAADAPAAVHWAATMVDRFHVAAEFLGFNLYTAMTILLGFCVWNVEAGVIVLACRQYGLGTRALLAGYLTLAVVSFGLLIPSSPGNIGVYQYMTILAAQPVRPVARNGARTRRRCSRLPVCADNTRWFSGAIHESLSWHRRRAEAGHELAAPHGVDTEVRNA